MANEPHFTITNRGAGFRMTFSNGYAISVQFGNMHYCEHKSMDFDEHVKVLAQHKSWISKDAEVAIIGPNGEWATKKFIHDANDDVVGYLSPDEVGHLIEEILKVKP